MLLYSFFPYLLPQIIQYGCILASLVFVVRLWRTTRSFGYALLAGVIVAGLAHGLLARFVVPASLAFAIINVWIAMVMAALTAIAWREIHRHTKAGSDRA